jgi:hypothetical protein
MRKTLAFSALGIVIVSAVYFGIAKENDYVSTNINGVWEDSSVSPDFQNEVMILSEQDGKIVTAHYLEWKGNKFVENGIGKRMGDSITYVTTVTLPIKGWSTTGTHELKLSKDGNTLRGIYRDNLNKSGPIVFKKKR